MPNNSKSVFNLIEHLFRHQTGQLQASLTRRFGFEQYELIEDAIQDTLLAALHLWPYRGVPDNPAGWLRTAVTNKLIDSLRKSQMHDRKLPELANELNEAQNMTNLTDNASFQSELNDDILAMMFACCHPELSSESQVALTLKSVCGFSVSEIARSFISSEATIAQRLTRAKQTLRQTVNPFSVPVGDDLQPRLDAVLESIYFLFNEGYSSHTGENLIRAELCHEALRLIRLLLEYPFASVPKTEALTALIYLQTARLPSRTSSTNDFLLLEQQDRTLWNKELIQEGLRHLERAASGEELSEFHLHAGIASCHAMAANYEDTDWEQILFYYDQWMTMNPSPVILLNRAVVISLLESPQRGMEELVKIEGLPRLEQYYLYHAVKADFLRRLGKKDEAARYYSRAALLTGSEAEKRYLSKRLKECQT